MRLKEFAILFLVIVAVAAQDEEAAAEEAPAEEAPAAEGEGEEVAEEAPAADGETEEEAGSGGNPKLYVPLLFDQ